MADKMIDDFDNQQFISFRFFFKVSTKTKNCLRAKTVLLSQCTEQSNFMNVKLHTEDACQIIGFQ